MASSFFSLRGVTLLGLLEALMVIRAFPEYANVQVCHNWICQSTVCIAWCLCGINYTLFCCYSTIIYPAFISPLRHVPTVKFWIPRLIYHWLAGRGNQALLLLTATRETPNNGLISLRELTRTRLLVTNTTVYAEILVNHPYDFAKPENMRSFLGQIVGDGIFVVEGEQHKFLRKNSLHAFGSRRIKNLQFMMWRSSQRLMDALEVEIKDSKRRDNADNYSRIEITNWANRTAMGIIGNAVFGRDFSDDKDDSALLDGFSVIFDPTNEMLAYFVLSAWLSFAAVRLLPWRMNRVFKDTTSTLRRICMKWVRERRVERERAESDAVERPDLLSLLLDPGILDDGQAVDQLLTYMAAGHDTTALTFTWACYLLAVDTHQQDALRSEINKAFPLGMSGTTSDGYGENGVAGVVERLPLLNRIISETLRLYPAVPVTIRCTIRDLTLDGQLIPKGTEILVSPWVMNRSRELWGADADEFRPDRWIGPRTEPGDEAQLKTTSGTDKYNMATFLHGPRSCIGQLFAREELRCLLAAMVTRFEWTMDMDSKDVLPGGAITIRPQSGLYLKLKPLK